MLDEAFDVLVGERLIVDAGLDEVGHHVLAVVTAPLLQQLDEGAAVLVISPAG
jgi:hypothetical protein